MIFNLNRKKITIKSEGSKFVFCEDSEKEFTQVITISKNGRLEFESYNFENELKRKEERQLSVNAVKLINDIEAVLKKKRNWYNCKRWR